MIRFKQSFTRSMCAADAASRFFDGADFLADVIAGEQLALAREFYERVGRWMHRHFAKMHDDERSAEPLGEVDCLKCLLDRALRSSAVGRGELVGNQATPCSTSTGNDKNCAGSRISLFRVRNIF